MEASQGQPLPGGTASPDPIDSGTRMRAGTISDGARPGHPRPPRRGRTPFRPGADAVPAAALTGAATFTAADAERVRSMTAMDIFREANAKRATFLATGAVLRQRGRLASAAPAGPSGRHLNPLAETEAPGKAAGPAGTGPRLAPVVPTWPPFKLAGLAFGLLCAVGVGQIPLSDEHPKAGTMLGVVLLIVSWWIAEVAPLGITALLPIVLFGPCGVGLSTKAVAATYFNHITFLLLGAFLVDLAIENSNLHKRFALSIIVRFGSSARVLLAAFMVVAWVMSMFCLNTSTTMMLVPFALGVIENAEALVAGEGPSHRAAAQKFGVGLLVGIAWASNVGGLGTLIGTAPNGVLVGVFNDLFPTAAVDLNFAMWMSWGLPLSVLLLLPAYAVVFFTYIYYGGAESLLKFDATVMQKALAQLGPMSFDEKVVAFVQALQIVLWIVRGALIEAHWGTCSVGGIATKHACKAANGKWTSPVAGWDAGIACGAALLLFFIPSRTRPGKRVLEWDDCPTRLPWGQLFLFGGGFAIAAGFAKSGLSAVIGQGLRSLNDATPFAATLAVVVCIAFMTEFTSNTATTSIMLPILAGAGVDGGINPLMYMLPAALAASLAFMFPIATPPNAIVFATGRLSFTEMCLPGVCMNVIAILMTAAITFGPARQILTENGRWTERPAWAVLPPPAE